jgi:hypothetical protein
VPGSTFNIFFTFGGARFDLAGNELRDSLREVLVFRIEEGELID